MLTFLFILVSGSLAPLPGAITKVRSGIFYIQSFRLDTLTIYNPSLSQCDSDPLTTASNKRIDITQLRNGSIRWMALSRDMLRRWGGTLHYGDTITLHSGDVSVDGTWVIQDTMNKRFKNRGDLLFDSSAHSNGMWTNVKIIKRKVYHVSTKSYS